MSGLRIVIDPAVLREHGFKDPLPACVTAAPKLWAMWLTNARRDAESRSAQRQPDGVVVSEKK